MEEATGHQCPFCNPVAECVFHRGQLVVGLWDAFPVSPGHALLVPIRHVSSWFEATREERIELLDSVDIARERVLQRHQPHGFNIGVNIGEVGGQTVPHLHVHLIPRYPDDAPDPRGGVRWVIPGKANYLARQAAGLELLPDLPHQQALVQGESDPLLPHLRVQLQRSVAADIAVAFVLRSGVDRLMEHLRDMLDRGGRLRLLTGDYFDVTEPEALSQLLDLEGRLELRVFETAGGSFHPKAYIFHHADGQAVAYVGSSNLSAAALGDGVEWNYRVISSQDARGLRDVMDGYERLFRHPSTKPLTVDWIEEYRKRRRTVQVAAVELPLERPEPPPTPHIVQQEALAALSRTRQAGNTAGLVVLATGLGKTWLTAFDSNRPEYNRVLFIAHREEILAQAMATFRRIRPMARLGKYTGTQKDLTANVLFASIQTLGRQRHLTLFARDSFDYVVVDEFHHASAPTYRRLIDYFTPKFLLGLTATPERTDGGDLLSLCGNNLVYRCDVPAGIEHGLLCAYKYFGVPDEVDYANIPWRSNRFDEEALTNAVATQKRATNMLEQYRKRSGKRTIAFCCSHRHADFTAQFFRDHGVKAVAVHSGATSAPRAASLEQLQAGALDVVCAVDMFNEGIDLPAIDTVMMLRPTESRILWLQQFGRGLRNAAGKPYLTVIDYIGNHRAFLIKPRALFGLGDGFRDVALMLERVLNGTAELPPGCEVTYDLAAIDILRSLLPIGPAADLIKEFYLDFRERQGIRPTASECYQEGYNPRAIRAAHGSWLRFVEHMGDLSAEDKQVVEQHDGFLRALEITPLTKSFKLITLLSMLGAARFPGEIGIEELLDGFVRLVDRTPSLKAEIDIPLSNPQAVRRLLEENPINAWAGGRGTEGGPYFAYADGVFRTTFVVAAPLRESFVMLVRELVEWRLAEYIGRVPPPAESSGTEFIAKVIQSSGRPIIMLPDRTRTTGVPRGTVPLRVGDQRYEADFAKVALNVIRTPGDKQNQLAEVLRGWFGPKAGQPGTSHRVQFRLADGVWVMSRCDGSHVVESDRGTHTTSGDGEG